MGGVMDMSITNILLLVLLVLVIVILAKKV